MYVQADKQHLNQHNLANILIHMFTIAISPHINHQLVHRPMIPNLMAFDISTIQ